VVEARASVDVWADAALLAVLRGGGYPSGSSAAEKDRLQHRAKGYEWREDHLVRRPMSGEARVIPRPATRGSLVKDVHERAGHLGVKKTLCLLRPHYWWVEMAADVALQPAGSGNPLVAGVCSNLLKLPPQELESRIHVGHGPPVQSGDTLKADP
jgi:hypothetical protein